MATLENSTDWHFVPSQLPVSDAREFSIEANDGHRFRIGHIEGPVEPPEGGS